MKLISKMTGLLALAILAVPHVVRAQEKIVADIPFAFSVGKMTLPAGEYSVQKMRADSPFLLVQRTDGSALTTVLSIAAQSNEIQSESKLVFHRYGDRYFLSQVWRAGYGTGRELPESPREKELALIARHKAPDQVMIVARLTP